MTAVESAVRTTVVDRAARMTPIILRRAAA